jgi:hypothetical protein
MMAVVRTGTSTAVVRRGKLMATRREDVDDGREQGVVTVVERRRMAKAMAECGVGCGFFWTRHIWVGGYGRSGPQEGRLTGGVKRRTRGVGEADSWESEKSTTKFFVSTSYFLVVYIERKSMKWRKMW